MRKNKNTCHLMLAGILITGCAPMVHVQKADNANLNKYNSYAWVKSVTNENDSSQQNAALYAEIAVQNAVNTELNNTWKEDTKNPDVIISYDLFVEKSRERVSESVYSQPYRRSYYNPYYNRWGSIYYPSDFLGYDYYTVPVKEGTLTITMMDAKTDKVIWQGWTTERLDNSRISEDEIANSAKNILSKLEVAQR